MKTITTKLSGLIADEFCKENCRVFTMEIPKLWIDKSPIYNGEIESLVMQEQNLEHFELLTL